ncbi:hypothetical protein RND71_044164 [Anisodus tanguticus]|uniref:Uncharacterized protein n=1 Tax=Anisodus tanguticus TaxID=243964 RepID=A0AAE1QP77_9SOLA|nr:hypothetical protein RND71_044164 [Anisodus tanguticus]
MEQAHDSVVWSLDWHPLGHILASGSNDHTCKFWTRNRPGDKMIDKYNLNLMPKGQEGEDYEDVVTAEFDEFDENVDAAIPGLGLTEEISNEIDHQKDQELKLNQPQQQRKVPFAKRVPKQFENQWTDNKSNSIVPQTNNKRKINVNSYNNNNNKNQKLEHQEDSKSIFDTINNSNTLDIQNNFLNQPQLNMPPQQLLQQQIAKNNLPPPPQLLIPSLNDNLLASHLRGPPPPIAPNTMPPQDLQLLIQHQIMLQQQAAAAQQNNSLENPINNQQSNQLNINAPDSNFLMNNIQQQNMQAQYQQYQLQLMAQQNTQENNYNQQLNNQDHNDRFRNNRNNNSHYHNRNNNRSKRVEAKKPTTIQKISTVKGCYETKTDSIQETFIKDNGLENNQKNLLRKAIKKSPPSSYLFNQRPLKSSASNDIVLMAALKSNENNIPFSVRETADEMLEQELAHNKKNLKTKKLDDDLEEEIEDLEEEIELDKELINGIELDRKINPNFHTDQDRLDEEEVEAEKEAIWLEEHGYQTPVDHRFKDARRLIHAYIGEDKLKTQKQFSFLSIYNPPTRILMKSVRPNPGDQICLQNKQISYSSPEKNFNIHKKQWFDKKNLAVGNSNRKHAQSNFQSTPSIKKYHWTKLEKIS